MRLIVAAVYDRRKRFDRRRAVTDRRYSGIGRPDGAWELGGAGGYKDFAPDGAANRLCSVGLRPTKTGADTAPLQR